MNYDKLNFLIVTFYMCIIHIYKFNLKILILLVNVFIF